MKEGGNLTKNEKMMIAINNNQKEKIESMFFSEEIDINEYNAALEAIKAKGFIDIDKNPVEYKMQFNRANRYYTALIIFVLIDIIPLLWLALFFVYFPVVIYTWIVAFGRPLLLPNDNAVEQNRSLNLFIILSWVPLISIGADIAILVKAISLKGQIKHDCNVYKSKYESQKRNQTSFDF